VYSFTILGRELTVNSTKHNNI